MKIFKGMFLCILFFIMATGFSWKNKNKEIQEITAFCGSASKPALEECAGIFEKNTGIKVNLIMGGSGTVLSQMKLSKKGDIYIPGSPDYMDLAKKDGLVYTETEKYLAYLVPSIIVQKGNPKNIRTLSDLSQAGLKVAIGNPRSVCVGLYAYEIFERAGQLENIKSNIVTFAESCDKTALLVSLKKVDAVMGWDVFEKWNPDNSEAVYLQVEEIPRIAYIPAAVSKYTKNRKAAQQFIDFISGKAGQSVFKKWGYIESEEAAKKIASNATIGGEYFLPDKLYYEK